MYYDALIVIINVSFREPSLKSPVVLTWHSFINFKSPVISTSVFFSVHTCFYMSLSFFNETQFNLMACFLQAAMHSVNSEILKSIQHVANFSVRFEFTFI